MQFPLPGIEKSNGPPHKKISKISIASRTKRARWLKFTVDTGARQHTEWADR